MLKAILFLKQKTQDKHIYIGTGSEYRHHTRIRLGLSSLNQQRFT